MTRTAIDPEAVMASEYNLHIMQLASQMNAALTTEGAIMGFETEPRVNLLRAIAMVLGIQAFCSETDEAGMDALLAIALHTFRSGEWVKH